MSLYPFGDFWKVLILLADVVFLREIDEIDDGFGGEEEERVYHLNLQERSLVEFGMTKRK